jgi:hypothetical protein
MIGSLRVFHTAPPQPRSKALFTWYAEFVGGAEASQKGFGDLIPAQLIDKSTMYHLSRLFSRGQQSLRFTVTVRKQ